MTRGHLSRLRPGQIAVSRLEAAPGAMGVHVGSRLTVYLPDGTPYRATVSAVYARSLASGDVLIPAAVTAGHTGTRPASARSWSAAEARPLVAGLAAAHPGWHVASRAAATTPQVRAATPQQNSFANLLILGVVAALAAVALVNTLAVATLERRRALRLLARSARPAARLAWCSAGRPLFVMVTGLAAGVAAVAP